MNHQRVRGSISLFLILILMPLFSGTYLAIDAGRAAAARSRLAGALDLTGNAALNDYDQALKDRYGLFAMAKSQETYESELAAVFSGTIDAGEATGDGTFDNYINTGTKEFSVSFPAEASLARPAVLERAVTGYMKYRGPYRFARGVSQRIGAFQHIREASDALSKSQDYYDDLSGVSKQLTKLADDLPADAEGFDAGAQKSAVKSILGGLDKLSSQVKKTDRSADAWKSSLDQMPEGEAKALLAGDYKATAGVLNDEGVTTLRDKLNADLAAIDEYNAAKQKAEDDRKAAEEALKAAQEAVDAGGEAPEGLIDPTSIQDPDPPALSYKDDALYGYIAGSRTKDSSDPEKEEKRSVKNALESFKNTDRTTLVSGVPDQYVSRAVGSTVAAAIDAVGSSAANVPTDSGGSVQSQMGGLKTFFRHLTGSTDSLLSDSYVEEFLTESFSCYTSGDSAKTLAGADLKSGPLFKGETEYLLFGQDYLPANVHLAADLLFAIRVLFNSIYAFSNAKMRAEALSVATAVAAWTGAGVAVAQNLILAAWAAAESVSDVSTLLKGGTVPLYKNAATWTLGLSGISNKLREGAVSLASHTIDDVYAAIEKAADDGIEAVRDAALSYFRETTEGAVESLTNLVLTPVEAKITTLIGDKSKESVSRDEVRAMLTSAVDSADNGSAGFAAAKAAFNSVALGPLTDVVTNNYKSLLSLDESVATAATTAIRHGVEDAYSTMFSEVKKAVDRKVSGVEQTLHNAFKEGGNELKADVTDAIDDYAATLSDYLGSGSGRTPLSRNTALSSYSGTAMSYKDYLKVFVFTGLVNNNVKKGMLTRAAKLMQAGCHQTETSFSIAKAYRKVELSGSAGIVTHTVKGRETYAY